ncbi:MAG: transporter substrate-binding domain-containing protein [Brotaphodocola sp.]
MKKWKNGVVLVSVMLLCGLSACGGAKSETAAGSAAESSDSGTPESSAAAVVKVGTGSSMPPYCYLDDNGVVQGYDVEVLKEVDKRLEQYEFDIQSMDFSTLIVSIDSKALDVVSHQLVKSDARKEKYLFPSEYYCLSPMVFAIRNDSGIKTMEDLAGKKIKITPTSYEYGMLSSYNESHPGKEIVLEAVSDLTTADALKMVSNGQSDIYLTYSSTYDNVQKELQLENLDHTDVLMCEDTYIMVASGEQELCDAIDGALKEMKEDGTLSKIAEEYLGQDVFSLYSDMIQAALDK